MKKRLAFVLALTAYLCVSCGESSENQSDAPSYYPFKESSSDNWGLVDAKGKVLVEDEFKVQTTSVHNGIFFTLTDGGYEMYSISDPTKSIGERYKDIALFLSDITPSVMKSEGIKYIDKKGKVKFELPLTYVQASSFNNGYSIIVDEEGHNGVVDMDGNIYQPGKFSIVDVLGKNKFLAMKNDNDGEEQFFIINDKNEEQKKLKSGFVCFSPDQKYYVFKDDGEYGVRKSKDDEVIIRAKYEFAYFLNNDYVAVVNSDGVGIMNTSGEVKIKNKYKEIIGYRDGNFIAKRDASDGYGLLDMDEDRTLKFEYSLLQFLPNSSNLLAKKEGDKSYYIINQKGETIKEFAEFDETGIPSQIETMLIPAQYSRYLIYPLMYVESDYFDVYGLVGSILKMDNKNSSDLYGYENMTPTTCKNNMFPNLKVSQVENDGDLEWTPWVDSKDSNKYGSVSYRLGFNEFTYVVYNFYTPEYYLSERGKCVAIKIKLKLNTKSSSHFDQIEESFGKYVKTFGFTNSESYEDEDGNAYVACYYNDRHALRVEFEKWNNSMTVFIYPAGVQDLGALKNW
ncbi:MAG: WG repeat-containing protein [Prevotellaceae bacterium]|nr:WG repeat-containing protein [Candidatus Colivivens equi]